MANSKNTNKKETETTKKRSGSEKNALNETTSSKQTKKKNTSKKTENAKEIKGKEKNTVVKKASEEKKASSKTKSNNNKKTANTKTKTKKTESEVKEEKKDVVVTNEISKKEAINKKSKASKNETIKNEEKATKKAVVKADAVNSKDVKSNSNKKQSKITVPTIDSEHRIKKAIIIIVVSVLFLALAYLLTVFILDNKDNNADESTSEAIIQYDAIMIGSSLAQNDDSYYVLISSDEDPNASTYSSYMKTYAQKENSLKIYTADYKEGFNKKYISESSNLLVSNINDLRITGSTLLKINNKAVVEAYEGNQILSAFSNLIK